MKFGRRFDLAAVTRQTYLKRGCPGHNVTMLVVKYFSKKHVGLISLFLKSFVKSIYCTSSKSV